MSANRQIQAEPAGAVTIRKLSDSAADLQALARLAERDSREPLEGAILIAEVEGDVVAATSLATGKTIADPFSRTVELRSLLELRAAQVRRRVKRPRFRGGTVVSRRRARAALAGSPPGAGGKLIELSR